MTSQVRGSTSNTNYERDEPALLVVEDDRGLQKQLKWSLEEYQLIVASTRQEALEAVQRHQPLVVLQDLGLPPDDEGVSEGFAALKEILRIAPATKIIVVTGRADRESALKAVRLGAYDFFQKPLDIDVLKLMLDRAFRMGLLERENRRLADEAMRSRIEGVVAGDDAMQKLCAVLEKVAPADVTVLLSGESGTGKEVLARALHRLSARRGSRCVAINCAAIPESLLESELFGYEKGSFTGAHKRMLGKVEVANGGTLFLDEIGDMPPALQAKLLRFLQERVIERIGGREEIPVDVRVVCATNRSLEELIATGKFREDLYYRLREVSLRVPPLRERIGGVMPLARFFIQRFSAELDRPVRGFAADALAAMEAYSWPGNVRELENRIKTGVVMAEGSLLTGADLGLAEVSRQEIALELREVRAAAERSAVQRALALSDNNLSRAADLLGISRPTLYDLLGKLNIQPS